MAKVLLYSDEARRKILSGVEQLAAAAVAAVVQILGKTALLYRPNPDRDEALKITF